MVRDLDDNSPLVGRIRGVDIKSNRSDGWYNAISGLGKRGIDKTESIMYGTVPEFTDDELSNMYMGEGIGKRIIDLPAKDAIRSWIDIPGDKDGKIQKELTRLKAKGAFRKALSWSRLYRGALIVIVEKGVKDLAKPLSRNVSEITSLRTYSAARVDVTTTDIVTDPHSTYFDEVEFFPVRLRNGTTIRVHASRCLVFKGEQPPDEGTVDFKYKYWGLPVMMQIYDRLKNWGATEKGVADVMQEFTVGIFTLSNMAQLLAMNNQEGLDRIYDRIDIINASKSVINSVLLGDGEAFDRIAASLSGVPEVMDRMQVSLSAVSNIPVTRLWGRSPAGENATGESDMRQYYDDISSYQESDVEFPLQKLINIIASYSGVSETAFNFNSLWQATKKEQADIDKTVAETDQVYITQGVFTSEEIYDLRASDYGIVMNQSLSNKEFE